MSNKKKTVVHVWSEQGTEAMIGIALGLLKREGRSAKDLPRGKKQDG